MKIELDLNKLNMDEIIALFGFIKKSAIVRGEPETYNKYHRDYRKTQKQRLREYQKKRYQDFKRKGLCVICGGKPFKKLVTCKKHRTNNKVNRNY